jgi:hypothetical protein
MNNGTLRKWLENNYGSVQRSEKCMFPLKHPAKIFVLHFWSDFNPLLYDMYTDPDSGCLTVIIRLFSDHHLCEKFLERSCYKIELDIIDKN